MTDTGAYTDVVFGLFRLLDYRFSPRIADVGGTRYWRADPTADYGGLNGVARHRINTRPIDAHWDAMLRLAGSLKLVVVQATSIMRTLQISDRPTKLAQAVAEFGRIGKTIHCLTYIDSDLPTLSPHSLLSLSGNFFASPLWRSLPLEARVDYWAGEKERDESES